MSKNSCPCPPDNCVPDCLKECAEACRRKCCEKKYLKLACKLLDTDLFVDSANYNAQVNHNASSDGPFYNILQYLADSMYDATAFTPTSDVVVNNQPVSVNALLNLGVHSGVTMYQFTQQQLVDFNAVTLDVSNFTFVINSVVSLLFGYDFVTYPTLQDARAQAVADVAPVKLAYLNGLVTSTADIIKQLRDGAYATVFVKNNVPYTAEVTFEAAHHTGETTKYTGKASLTAKDDPSVSSPCDGSLYFLMISARPVVPKCGPL